MRQGQIGCYVLIGYPKDTMDKAEKRLTSVVRIGAMPFAMLWRDKTGKYNEEWRRFQRSWANHTIVGARIKDILR